MVKAYLSLGSNIEDRMEHLALAEKKLSEYSEIRIVQLSKVYETSPWFDDAEQFEKNNQQFFLNQVLEIKTSLGPDELLMICQKIEKELGRVSKGDYAPRTIDIDILLYGNQVVESDHLTIPHHHMVDRRFVLTPLLEIAPDLIDPNSGKPFRYFLQNIKDDHKVETYL